MSIAIIEDVKALLAKLQAHFAPEIKAVENEAKAIGDAALTYIENNGLNALYNIATAALLGAATGTPWATIGATVVKQGEAAGISIAKGAETVVLAQAQADLIAVGKLLPPGSTLPIANPVVDVPVS